MLATPIILLYPDRLSLHHLTPLTLPLSYSHMALPHAPFEGTDTDRTCTPRGAMTLTVTDQGYTKAVILVPCREDMGAEAIAELFKERVFPYTGTPTKLISDRDTRFTSS